MAERLLAAALAVASGEVKKAGEGVGRRGAASRRGCDARTRTARGQREQESGDEWRTRGAVFLKLDHCSSDSVLNF